MVIDVPRPQQAHLVIAAMKPVVGEVIQEKQKKEESVAKQIAMQEARIKALEADVERQKKKKEEVEKAKKYDENRFFKFKQDMGKDLQ